MKAYLQKLIGTAVLGLALFSNSIPAWAGAVYLYEVTVDLNRINYEAGGSMAGARYSTDSQQYIGCSFSNTNGPFVMCSATDKTGKSSFCTSTNLSLVAAVKAITDFSYIE